MLLQCVGIGGEFGKAHVHVVYVTFHQQDSIYLYVVSGQPGR